MRRAPPTSRVVTLRGIATEIRRKEYPMPSVTVIDHPLVQHKLSLLRSRETGIRSFRRIMREIAMMVGYEVLRDMDLVRRTIETPLASMEAPFLKEGEPVLISVLRAGNGLLEGMLELAPSAPVGYIGLARDPQTLQANEYYFKAPRDLADKLVVVLDPMLGTANTASAALSRLKDVSARSIRLMSLLAAPEGVDALARAHPDVPVFTAAIDQSLDDHGYLVPGIGDVGDRLCGT